MLKLACPKVSWTILGLTFFLASSVAQVVEADIGETCTPQGGLEVAICYVLSVQWCADYDGEYEAMVVVASTGHLLLRCRLSEGPALIGRWCVAPQGRTHLWSSSIMPTPIATACRGW
jgi:hypothetical protein